MPTSRRPGRKPDGPPRTGPSRPWLDFEMEVVQGLEEFAEGELARRMGADAIVVGRPVPGRIAIRYRGSPAALNGLRSVAAVHMIESYEVARPRALLGHENLTRLRRLIEGIVGLFPRGSFETFRISAAGADSSTFKRLGDEIGTVTRLVATEEPARLQLAFRRTPGLRTGWQVLVRLSPMPLSARKWRVCDLPGALNATIAHVMVELAGVPQDGTLVNLACGSGTLMAEGPELGPTGVVLGCDTSTHALECASANIRAAGRAGRAQLLLADARRVPAPMACADAIVADMPYGMLSGAGVKLGPLYSGVVPEATRLARPGAALVVITSARKHFEDALRRHEASWRIDRVIRLQVPFRSGYIKPQIYVLRRRP